MDAHAPTRPHPICLQQLLLLISLFFPSHEFSPIKNEKEGYVFFIYIYI